MNSLVSAAGALALIALAACAPRPEKTVAAIFSTQRTSITFTVVLPASACNSVS